MKKVIITSLLVVFGIVILKATTVVYSFTYDAAGNRTGRIYEILIGEKLEADSLDAGIDISDSKRIDKLKQFKSYPDEVGEFEISLYPNPTYNELFIEFTNSPEDLTVVSYGIYDLNGKQIWQETSDNKLIKVDLSMQPEGQYYLILNVNGQTKTYKVIKK